MILRLSRSLRITCDTLNYTLEQRSVATKGKNVGQETWTALGHYPSLERACLRAFEMAPGTVQEPRSAVELVEAIREGAKRIAEACRAFQGLRAAEMGESKVEGGDSGERELLEEAS